MTNESGVTPAAHTVPDRELSSSSTTITTPTNNAKLTPIGGGNDESFVALPCPPTSVRDYFEIAFCAYAPGQHTDY